MAVLTVSREYGSGGREVGRMVADGLGWRYEDRATVLAALRAADPRWERWGREYDEHRPSLWERFDWSFRGYVALMQGHLLEAAAAGAVVIVGRGGNFLLEGIPAALRIRVVAGKYARIERIMRREQADREAVKRLVDATDRERAGFIRAVYRRDWDDPAAYDRTYDTDLVEPDAVAADVTARLAALDRADPEPSRRALALRCAAGRVRAALFTDPHLRLPLLEVAEKDGAVVVHGTVHAPEQLRRVEELAGREAGGHRLRFELRYR